MARRKGKCSPNSKIDIPVLTYLRSFSAGLCLVIHLKEVLALSVCFIK